MMSKDDDAHSANSANCDLCHCVFPLSGLSVGSRSALNEHDDNCKVRLRRSNCFACSFYAIVCCWRAPKVAVRRPAASGRQT